MTKPDLLRTALAASAVCRSLGTVFDDSLISEPNTAMIELKTDVQLKGVSAKAIADFLLHCTDRDYQHWWPGTHLAWRTKKQFPNEIGSVVYFDEYVGQRRLKLETLVVRYISTAFRGGKPLPPHAPT